jgi:hypothetical protein
MKGGVMPQYIWALLGVILVLAIVFMLVPGL